jgi:hypothetical protein
VRILSSLKRGTSTATLSASGFTVTLVDHSSWPGARPETTYSPPSTGAPRFHSSASTAWPLRVITSPSTRLSSGTLMVRYESRGSRPDTLACAISRFLGSFTRESASEYADHAEASWWFFSRQSPRRMSVPARGSMRFEPSNASHARPKSPAARS